MSDMDKGEDVIIRARKAFAAFRGLGREIIDELIGELDGERRQRDLLDKALRSKDAAMGVLFQRLHKAGIDTGDLIP